MNKRRASLDQARILAVVAVITAVVYFHISIFSPALIPKSLRLGTLRHPLNILILGTDITYDRVTLKPMPDHKGRADTILLAHIDPLKERISLLSIPRDTLVNIPGYGQQKINFANAAGGIDLTRRVVYEMTGKMIDHYIEVKPTAITRLVDILGGVTIDIAEDMRYRDRAQGLDINLKKGRQHLSGRQAHDYIRYRDNIRGDIVRIEHHQSFMKAVAREMIRPSKIIRAPLALWIALDEIKTDLPISGIIRLLNTSRTISTDKINTIMVPGDVTMEARVGSVWIPDELSLQKELNEYF